MIRRLLFGFSGRLPCRLIDIDGQPYLERYYVGRVLGLTFYLHRFVSGDDERNVHDHPWSWCLALVLAGGYTEERLTGFDTVKGWFSKDRRIRWWRPNFFTSRDFHRIKSPAPNTWTLFIHARRCKGWGFLTHYDDATIYHQPFDASASAGWHLDAPVGRDAQRVAL